MAKKKSKKGEKTIYVGTGMSQNKNPALAGKEAVEMAIKNAGAPPDYGVVFCSSDFNLKKIVKSVHETFKAANPECKWIGCSTAGEISNYGVTQGSCVVMAVKSKYITIGVGVGDDVHKGPYKAGVKGINHAINSLKMDKYVDPYVHFLAMKNKKTRDLVKLRPYSLLLLAPGTTVHKGGFEDDVLNGIMSVTGEQVPVVGGSAGDDLDLTQTYQFANGKMYKDAAVMMLGIYDVPFGFGIRHGFKPSNVCAVVTDSNGYTVHKLDGKPAAEEYAKMLGKTVKQLWPMRKTYERLGHFGRLLASYYSRMGGNLQKLIPFFQVGARYPLAIPDIQGNYWLRLAREIKSDGSMTFYEKVPSGITLQKMKCSQKDIYNAAKDSFKDSIKESGGDPAFSLVFECILRKGILGDKKTKQVYNELIKEHKGLPFIGFYGYGEFGFTKGVANGQFAATTTSFTVSRDIISE